MQSIETRTCIHEMPTTEPADRANLLLRHLQELPESRLPLQAACQHGGWADAGDRTVGLIDSRCDGTALSATVAVYFNETVGGCNCNDDPVSHPAYARLLIVTRLADGMTTIALSEADD
ncbi:MAG: hypothetical protein KDI88_13625 [Gammaproteobacteria bacterium]|nr:hypothetical protein [Gammaproteobacteria bacterium]